jgi:hypothetical protein
VGFFAFFHSFFVSLPLLFFLLFLPSFRVGQGVFLFEDDSLTDLGTAQGNAMVACSFLGWWKGDGEAGMSTAGVGWMGPSVCHFKYVL